jgi:hypothetical protein
MSMDELARDVLSAVKTAETEKTASTAPNMTTELGSLLCKVAEEIRTAGALGVTYADITAVAEVRRAR